jgi:hypothetical protein
MTYNSSGEFFDLTITSYNNAFGKKKIEGALQYGLTPPLQKYIDELLMIIPSDIGYVGAQGSPGTADDKTPKRIARVNFLKYINNYPIFQNYFLEMMKYLNGIENIGDFSNNYLIFSIAGGNIIVIFTKLLWELYQYTIATNNGTSLPLLSIFNQKVIQNTDIAMAFNDVFRQISTNPEFITLWEELSSKSFSDFDYNLLPSPQLNNQRDLLNSCPPPQQSSAGFVLFRVKTLIENGVQLPKKIPNGKKACKNVLINNKDTQDTEKGEGFTWDMYKKLFAQGVQQNFIDSLNNFTEDQEKNKENCLNFINYLLAQKASIEHETKLNVEVAGKLFQMGYSYQQDTLRGPENISVIPAVESEVGSFMNYLHTVTRVINTYIYYWEQGRQKVSEGGLRIGKDNEELSNLLASFCNLDTILESRVLMRLSSDIINYFLNLPCTPGNISPCSETILEKILEEKRKQFPGASMGPSKLVLVPSDQFIYSKLSKVESYLKRTQYSEIGYPDGINITINAIKTEPIATMSATVADTNVTDDTSAFDDIVEEGDLPKAKVLNDEDGNRMELELPQRPVLMKKDGKRTLASTKTNMFEYLNDAILDNGDIGQRNIVKARRSKKGGRRTKKGKNLKTRKKARKLKTKKYKTKNIKRKTRVFKRKN